MEIKVGTDIVWIHRIAKLDKKSLAKIFHPNELENAKPETLAGIFAAKESCKKVFNDLDWLDIEVTKEEGGKPVLHIDVEGVTSYDISISHDGEYATATVIFSLR